MVTYSNLKRSEKRALEEPLQMPTGYVLDFSNRTIEEYFEDEFKIYFYDDKFNENGESKAKRLRSIWNHIDTAQVANVLRSIWDYRSTLPQSYKMKIPEDEDRARNAYFKVIQKLECENYIPDTDAIDQFDNSETLGNLLNAIERDIRSDEVAVALDRLHTYCQKKFRFLLEIAGQSVSKNQPLHSRVGAYAKLLFERKTVSEMSVRILKNSISIFESFNHVRNDQTFAHDNELVGAKEARFIYDSISAVLRFLKAVETDTFGD